MKRDESSLVANSPSEPKFSESIRCQKMVEIHGYNEHISVTGEDDNPCHATLSDSMNSVRNYSDVGLFMVGDSVSRSRCWNTSPFFIDDLLIVLSRIVGDETSTPTQSIKNGEVFQHPDLDTESPTMKRPTSE